MAPVLFLLIGLVGLMLIGLPLGFAIFITSAGALLIFTDLPFWQIIQRFFAGIDSFVLTAIPFFLLAGNLMNSGQITDRLMNLASAMVGHIRGGLAQINVVTSLFFGGISGSAVADTCGEGTIIIPSMIKRGYSKSFTVAITATSSVLGQIIPPSLIMIIYAATAGVSVQALFVAGIIPGILFAISQMVISYIYAIKNNYPRERRKTLKEFWLCVKDSFLVLLMPLIIMGGVLSGIVTATESAVIAVVYSLIITIFVYKTLTFKDLIPIFVNTAKSTAVTLFCIGAASAFGYLLAYFRINDMVLELITVMNFSKNTFIFFVIGLFFVLGMFMDSTPATYIFVPIVLPTAIALGIHPVHIGMVICLALGFGLITPPYGLCLLLGSQIAGINPKDAFKDIFVQLIGVIIVLLAIAFWEDFILFLPRIMVPKYV